MVLVMKQVCYESPDLQKLIHFCSALSNGSLDKMKLCNEIFVSPFRIDIFAGFLVGVGFIRVNEATYSLTDRGKVFVEKMAEVYKFMLSRND